MVKEDIASVAIGNTIDKIDGFLEMSLTYSTTNTLIRGSEFSSYKIELRNRVMQNNVTLTFE